MTEKTFMITFGSQLAHGKSWVRVVAPRDRTARLAAFEHFGRKWSMLRPENEFDETHFPDGEMFAFSTDENLNFRRIR